MKIRINVTLFLVISLFATIVKSSGLPDCKGSPADDSRFKGTSDWHDCNGTFESRNSTYIGEWRYGKAHGDGSLHSRSGARYNGSWENGKRNGRGIQYFANGDIVEAMWKNDRALKVIKRPAKAGNDSEINSTTDNLAYVKNLMACQHYFSSCDTSLLNELDKTNIDVVKIELDRALILEEQIKIFKANSAPKQNSL